MDKVKGRMILGALVCDFWRVILFGYFIHLFIMKKAFKFLSLFEWFHILNESIFKSLL